MYPRLCKTVGLLAAERPLVVADGEENRCDRSKPRKHPNAVGVPGALVFYRISRHEYQIGGSLCCRLGKVVYYSPVRLASQ